MGKKSEIKKQIQQLIGSPLVKNHSEANRIAKEYDVDQAWLMNTIIDKCQTENKYKYVFHNHRILTIERTEKEKDIHTYTFKVYTSKSKYELSKHSVKIEMDIAGKDDKGNPVKLTRQELFERLTEKRLEALIRGFLCRI